MARSWQSYAPPREAPRELQLVLRAWLNYPDCGVTEQSVAHMRSHANIVMRCTGCRLRYHVRSEDLAASVRRLAEKTTDEKQRRLDRIAVRFEPYSNRRYVDGAPRDLARDRNSATTSKTPSTPTRSPNCGQQADTSHSTTPSASPEANSAS